MASGRQARWEVFRSWVRESLPSECNSHEKVGARDWVCFLCHSLPSGSACHGSSVYILPHPDTRLGAIWILNHDLQL